MKEVVDDVLKTIFNFVCFSCTTLTMKTLTSLKKQRLSITHPVRVMAQTLWPGRTCADPESFVRGGGGPTLFSLMTGERIQLPLKSGHHWPTSEMPFKWHFAGGPMMAQH